VLLLLLLLLLLMMMMMMMIVSSFQMTQVDDEIKFGMIEAISHLIHRDYEAIVQVRPGPLRLPSAAVTPMISSKPPLLPLLL
jgi:hypothetical protein